MCTGVEEMLQAKEAMCTLLEEELQLIRRLLAHLSEEIESKYNTYSIPAQSDEEAEEDELGWGDSGGTGSAWRLERNTGPAELKEETKLQAKRKSSLESKLKGRANRLESRAQRVEEEAERAKENLHLHFTTLETALCCALREREAELAAQIDDAVDDLCATLLQHRAEASSLSLKLHFTDASD